MFLMVVVVVAVVVVVVVVVAMVVVVVVLLLLLLFFQYCEILKTVGSILPAGCASHFLHRLVFDLLSRHSGLETDLCPSTNKQAEEFLGGTVSTRLDLLCQVVFSLCSRALCDITMYRIQASASSVDSVECWIEIRSDKLVNADVRHEAYVSPAVLRKCHDKKPVTKLLC
jgi:hypothetical protein